MNFLIPYSFFARQFNSVRNLHKTSVVNSYINKSRGTRLVEKARKHKRPEDLEDPFYYGIGPKPKVEQVYQSLAARGFGKELPSYTPPDNVQEQLHSICMKVFGPLLKKDWKTQSLEDKVLKFKLITKGMEQFRKDVPNSILHKITVVSDLLEHFNTPVDGAYHYDALVRDKDALPPNLQVLPDTPRFNSETDQLFQGVTAFPGRKRTVFTKTGEKFEKVIEWPNI